jgi:hypothetical protein
MGKCPFDGQTPELGKSNLFSIGYRQGRAEGGPLAEQGCKPPLFGLRSAPNYLFAT